LEVISFLKEGIGEGSVFEKLCDGSIENREENNED